MAYPQAVRYLNSFVNYEKKNRYSYRQSFKLERIQGFLRLLGNPQASLKCLHVAGTKGKGSVCVFLAYILKEAGFKVGLYTSPHLLDFRERIRVLKSHKVTKSQGRQSEFEGMINRKAFTILVEKIKPCIEKYRKISKYGDLTFFEVYTAVAFMYFKEQQVDYAVLETGLGGRLDATNTVNPLACGITPISYDHMDMLGTSLTQIAKEKAGIIKSPRSTAHGPQLIVVSAPQEKEAQEIIEKRCRKEKAKLYAVGKDIAWRARTVKRKSQSFEVRGIKRKYANLRIKLLGEHQWDNATLAIGMAEALENEHISSQAIRKGLMNARWPGRLEEAGKKPIIILDGAQNAASAGTLIRAIKKYFTYRKLILVLGISGDKDIRGICQVLGNIADRIILTKAQNPRAAECESIKKFIAKPLEFTSQVKRAIVLAKHMAGYQDLILITGSLFVVAEARRFLRNDRNLWK